MRIVLTNDDGIGAPGLAAAVCALQGHEIIVVAPDSERSAASGQLTIRKPLKYRRHSMDGVCAAYSCDGSPVDCAKLALGHLCVEKPDLLISGFNHGLNVGYDVFYSGTIAAALEGLFLGIPALAVSLEHPVRESLDLAVGFVSNFASIAADWAGAGNHLLSVNIPAARTASPIIARQGCASYRYWYVEELDGDDPACWLRGEYLPCDWSPETDARVVESRNIAISVLRPSFCVSCSDSRRLLADLCLRLANGYYAKR
ncbi:MAG: 5'/3'-nucleotidase SurE [Planctomycetota bacterium]